MASGLCGIHRGRRGPRGATSRGSHASVHCIAREQSQSEHSAGFTFIASSVGSQPLVEGSSPALVCPWCAATPAALLCPVPYTTMFNYTPTPICPLCRSVITAPPCPTDQPTALPRPPPTRTPAPPPAARQPPPPAPPSPASAAPEAGGPAARRGAAAPAPCRTETRTGAAAGARGGEQGAGASAKSVAMETPAMHLQLLHFFLQGCMAAEST